MTQIPPQPPPPPPPAPPGGTPQPLPSVTVTNPPSALTSLPIGTQIEATVAATEGQAAVRVESDIGSLQLQTPLPLEKGSILNLVLQSLGPRVQLQITTINGTPPHIALRGLDVGGLASPTAQKAVPQATTPAVQQPGAATTVSPTAVQGVTSLIGTTVTATILRPVGLIPSPAGPGQTLPGAIPPSTSPGIAAIPPKGPAGVPVGPTTPPSPGRPVNVAAQAAEPLVRGSRIPMLVTAVRLPSPNAPTTVAPSIPTLSTSPVPGQIISATVTGSAPNGQTIVQTPLGPMSMPLAMALPRGMQLTLEITERPLLPDAERTAPLPTRAQTLFRARHWPAMTESLQALQNTDPAMAQHLAAGVLPRADTQLAATIIFFLSALRGGDVAGWLGTDALRILQRERPNLASRVRDEFREIGTLAAKPMTGDWRIALIPFFNGADIEQARLFLHPYGGGDARDEGSPKGTRFIIDVDLSRFGRMQLDGLAQDKDKNKRLDLIVRSNEPLPSAMQNDIRTIFREANELIGIEGGLIFQAAPANFVEIAPDDEPDAGSDLFA